MSFRRGLAGARWKEPAPPAGQPPLSSEEETNIRVYNKVSPGVVNITSIVVEFDFFLSPVAKPGTGSGAVLDRDGNIVTNYHVIASAREMEVALPDQTKYSATVVGSGSAQRHRGDPDQRPFGSA